MPTVITHSIFALSLAHPGKNSELPGRLGTLAIACSLLPDLDVIGFRFGIAYADAWGHRGLSHSLFFALLTSFLVVLFFFRQVRSSHGEDVLYYSFGLQYRASTGPRFGR